MNYFMYYYILIEENFIIFLMLIYVKIYFFLNHKLNHVENDTIIDALKFLQTNNSKDEIPFGVNDEIKKSNNAICETPEMDPSSKKRNSE